MMNGEDFVIYYLLRPRRAGSSILERSVNPAAKRDGLIISLWPLCSLWPLPLTIYDLLLTIFSFLPRLPREIGKAVISQGKSAVYVYFLVIIRVNSWLY